VEQFDQSPQTSATPEEQRADFITVSLPRAQMAEFPHGAVLQFGAIAARAGAALDGIAHVAEVDSGYLGHSLNATHNGGWILEGLSVQLPEDPDPDEDGLATYRELQLGTDPDNPDSDGDGLLDGWEVIYQLDPMDGSGLDGAEGDPDGDGSANLDEQIAGTNPIDSQSVLRLRGVKSSETGVHLAWFGTTGRHYILEVSSELPGPYTPYPATGFPREGRDRSEEFILPPDQENRYFRMRILEQ